VWLTENGIGTVTILVSMTRMSASGTTACQAVHRGYAANFLSDATGTLAVTNACRVGDGRGAAPGCSSSREQDAVFPGDEDGGVGKGRVRQRGTDVPERGL